MGQKISYDVQRRILSEDLSPLGIEYCYPLSRNLVIRTEEPKEEEGGSSSSSPTRKGEEEEQQCSFACCKIPAGLLPSLEQEQGHHDGSASGGKRKWGKQRHGGSGGCGRGDSGERHVAVKVIPKSGLVMEDRGRYAHRGGGRGGGSGMDSERLGDMDEQLKVSLFYTLCQLYNIPEQLIVRIIGDSSAKNASAAHDGGHGDGRDDDVVVAVDAVAEGGGNAHNSRREPEFRASAVEAQKGKSGMAVNDANGVENADLISSSYGDDDDGDGSNSVTSGESDTTSDGGDILDSETEIMSQQQQQQQQQYITKSDDHNIPEGAGRPLSSKRKMRQRSFSTHLANSRPIFLHTSVATETKLQSPPTPIFRTSSFDSSTGSYLNRPSDTIFQRFNGTTPITSPPNSIESDGAWALFSVISPKKSTVSFHRRTQSSIASSAQRKLDFGPKNQQTGSSTIDPLVFAKKQVDEASTDRGSLQKEQVSELSSSLASNVNAECNDGSVEYAAEDEATKHRHIPMNGVFPPKHANIPLLYGCYESDKAFYVILDYHDLSIEDLLKFNKSILVGNDVKRRFAFYQMLQSVLFCHKSGFSHGKIQPSTILVNDMLWVYLTSMDTLYAPKHDAELDGDGNDHKNQDKNIDTAKQQIQITRTHRETTTTRPSASDIEKCIFSSRNHFVTEEKVIVPRSRGGMSYGEIVAPVASGMWRVLCHDATMRRHVIKDMQTPFIGKLPMPGTATNRQSTTRASPSPTSSNMFISHNKFEEMRTIALRWQMRELSNYDYLMALNTRVGRRLGDHQFHPVFPWVIDFKTPTSWRLLSKSKYRLTKGDEMLDMTFNSRTPHHITEPLSEITYFSYLARCTPVNLLTRFVRHKFVPEEYPATVERMYLWTPDECIPEFYSDATIFKSIHSNMGDLTLPSWASSTEDFISKHRAALESDHVSSNIHHWLDIVFGYKLSGKAAVKAKNVVLQQGDLSGMDIPVKRGFYQLFFAPHPPRNTTGWSSLLPHAPHARKSRNVSGLSLKGSPLENIGLLTSYEQTMKFSWTYFSPPQYHIVPLISRRGSKREFTQQDLFLDDMFALGCLLAELYTFTPLFTLHTLNLYVQGKYEPQFEHIPQPVRDVVEMLVVLDAPKRKKALRSPNWKRLFPSQFKFVYLFLSRFYKLPTIEQRRDYALKMEHKIVELPEEAFELAFQHVIHMFLGSKALWATATQLLCEKLFAVRIRHQGHCESIKSQLRPRLHDMFAETENEQLQIQLFSYTMVRMAKSIVESKKTFLEKILPFIVEGLHSRFPRVALRASNTLLKLSENDLGIILTLQHLVEPMLERISRLYMSSLSTAGQHRDSPVATNNEEPHIFVMRTLVKLALLNDPTNIISYYVPKFLRIIVQGINLVRRKHERKVQDEEDDISNRDHPENANDFDIYSIFYQLLAATNNQSSTINHILLNNENVLVTIFEGFEFLSVYTFDKLCSLLRHLLLICDLNVRLQMVQALSPALKRIFHSEIVWDIQLTSGVLLSSSSSTVVAAGDSKVTNDRQDDIEMTTVSSKESLDLDTNDRTGRPRRSTIKGASALKSLVDKFKNLRSPINSAGEQVEREDNIDDASPSSELGPVSPQKSQEGSISPQSPYREDVSFTFTKLHMEKACIMYRELCRIVGNTHASSAVQNSLIFEEQISQLEDQREKEKPELFENGKEDIQSPIPAFLEDNNDGDEDYVEDSVTSSLRDSLIQSKSSLSWVLDNDTTLQNVCVPSEDAFYLNFRGNFETQLRSPNNTESINSVDVLANDERLFVTGDARSMVEVWNLESGNPTFAIPHHVGHHRPTRLGVSKVKFFDHRRGTSIASCDGSSIHLWDTETRKTKMFIGGGSNDVQYLTFEQNNVDSNMLITTTDQSTVKSFDLRTNKPCFEWKLWPRGRDHLSQSNARPQIRNLMCSDPSDHYISVGLSNGNVFLLEQHSGVIIDSFDAHSGEVTGLHPFASGLFFSMSSEHQAYKPILNTVSNPPASLRLWDTTYMPSECVKFYTPPSRDDTVTAKGALPTIRKTQDRASKTTGSPTMAHPTSDVANSSGNVIGLVGSTQSGIMAMSTGNNNASTTAIATTMTSGNVTTTAGSSSSVSTMSSATASGAPSRNVALDLQQPASQNFQSFVDVNVSVGLEQLFAVTPSTICHVANFSQLADASTFDMGSEHCSFTSIYSYKNGSGNFFTGVRLLPLHKLLLVTSQDGSVNLFS